MKLFAPIAIAATVLLGSSAVAQDQQQVTQAQAAATAWMALLDAGQYADSYTQSATLFRGAITQDNWVKVATEVRQPLGTVTSRTLKSAQSTRTLPNVPTGEYVVIQYDTTFANRGSGVEIITPMRDTDGTWKVSGYFIR